MQLIDTSSDRYAEHFPIATDFPLQVDLRDRLPPADDQGDLGSCTGLALAPAVGLAHALAGRAVPALSALFIYWNARVEAGTQDRDGGADLEQAIRGLLRFGACPDGLWPHEPGRVLQEPPAAAFAAALPYRITKAYRISSLSEILSCLIAGRPFALGFEAFESLASDRIAVSGRLRVPGRTEQSLGGHAVLAVGYDLRTKTLLVRNTWGPHWGAAGHVSIPLSYATDPRLSVDGWMVEA